MLKKLDHLLSDFVKYKIGYFISLMLILYLPYVVFIFVLYLQEEHTFAITVARLAAAFLLSCGIAQVVSLIFPPPRQNRWFVIRQWLFWIIWSLFAVISFSEIFLMLKFDIRYASSIVQLLLETNFSESKDFITTFYLNSSGLLGSILLLAIVILPIQFNEFLGRCLNPKVFRWLLLAVLLPGYAMVGFDVKAHFLGWDGVPFVHQKYLSVENLAYSYVDYRTYCGKDLTAIIAATEKLRDESVSCAYTTPNIVLIIGESFSKYHSSLYGYPVRTNPQLEQRRKSSNLYVFKDVISCSNATSPVLKSIFSLKSADMVADNDWADAPIFPAVFKKCGYRSLLISNQVVKVGGNVTEFAIGYYLNNDVVERSAIDGRNSKLFRYDEELIGAYQELAAERKPYNLVVFHLNGQHISAANKFPAEFTYFTVDSIGREELPSANRQEIADYDNATRYNDYVVDQMIRQFEKEDAVLVYCSDHGEEVNDYRVRMGRTGGRLSRQEIQYQCEIPFMIWVSDTFKLQHPELASRIAASVDRPFMTDDISQLLFDLAGVECRWSDRRRSVISDSYNAARPRILCGGDYVYEEVMKKQ